MFLIQLMIVLLALYIGSRYGSLALGAISGTGLAASACSYKRGLDLGKDPAFQARLKDPEMYEYMYGSTATSLGKEISASAKRAVYIFLASIAVIVLFASCQRLLPSYEDGSRLKMNIVIQIVMLTAAALMVIVSKASPEKAVAGSVWQSGMVAVVAIYGIAWLADTFFANYMSQMQESLAGIVRQYPWSIAFVFFAVSVLINCKVRWSWRCCRWHIHWASRDLCFWVYCQASMAISSYRTILRTSLRSTSTAAERP